MMPSTQKINCVITGKPTVYSGDFLQKKIHEYGSEDNLIKYYICREVKAFLKKGYKCADIRKVLNVCESVLYPSDDVVLYIQEKFGKKSILKDHPSFNNALTGFTYNKTDSDVEQFIKEYIIKV
jgi:hypothetical protein